MKRIKIYASVLFCLIQLSCTNSESFKVIREVTGPYQTNCYLIYGTKSKEAALIDPGWRIDTLVAFIKDNNLDLKYILITHGHTDHYYYVPELKKQFPKVRWGVNREDYKKIILCPDWPEKAYGLEWTETARKNPEENVYLDFDSKSAGEPDFFVEGNQTYKLGSVNIKTIHTPGHSPGSVCYYTGNVMFSGDMLFYRSVGNLDFLTSNTEDFIKSVRELYRLFPDSTIVYPGHNQPTEIGSEKVKNERISLTGGLKTWWHLPWASHNVIRINGPENEIRLPAKFRILTESWNRVVAVPYIVFIPEKDRVLMLVSCDYPHQAMILHSGDHGATWSQPKYVHTDTAGKPDTGMGIGLTYLGNGKVLMVSGTEKGLWVWFSYDYGETWNDRAIFPPASNGLIFNFGWDPPLIDRDPQTGKVREVIAGGYILNSPLYEDTATPGYSIGGIRISKDGARTWDDVINVPEWLGANEVAFIRAKNGDIVAACRTDWPDRFRKNNLDHYEGLGVSISKDNGRTWSKITRLYEWGRHHPCMVVLPNNDIVMTYVVRKGYPDTDDGYPQFGIEAIVSHDNGQTWDLDHRYILSYWKGIRKGPNAWYGSSQATSTVLLSDGSLLTTFGTGYRAVDSTGKGKPIPRDVGLINWNVYDGPLSSDRTITDAPFDSDLRNEFNPDPSRKEIRVYCPAQPEKENLAVPSAGAVASASGNDGDPSMVFSNAYNHPVLTLESLPAWVEISWPKQQLTDEIHIKPGAPEWFNRPSTECVPLDYRLQYKKGNEWIDIVPAVRNAKRYSEFYGDSKAYLIQDEEFEYIHKFAPVPVKTIRLYITRSSDTGKRHRSGDKVEVTEARRQTSLRAIEVFAAKKPR